MGVCRVCGKSNIVRIKQLGWFFRQRRRIVFFLCLMVCALALPPGASGQSADLEFGLTSVYGQPAAPQLDLPGVDGKRYQLAAYQGSVVLVNFWATWCAPCIHEMPTLQKLREKLKGQRFEVLAVNLGEDEERIRAFMEKFTPKLEFPILLAHDQSIMQAWKIQGLPISYLVDNQGRWVYQALGPRDFSHPHIVSRIEDLLEK